MNKTEVSIHLTHEDRISFDSASFERKGKVMAPFKNVSTIMCVRRAVITIITEDKHLISPKDMGGGRNRVTMAFLIHLKLMVTNDFLVSLTLPL